MSIGLWAKSIDADELKQKKQAAIDLDGRQIALFHTGEGVFACSNLCPHEGFPLAEGVVDGNMVLTCGGNSCKFDLYTGTNLLVGDKLRVYPVEERGGHIWIDVLDPPIEDQQHNILVNLCDAFDAHDYPRISRDLARLIHVGADPLEAVRGAIAWSCDRLQYGMTEAYAGAADWLTLYEERPAEPVERLVCLQEIIGHIAQEVQRERNYPLSAMDQSFEETAMIEAIMAEDETTALSLLRGGVDAGLMFDDFEPALVQASLRHYTSHGDPLIFTHKARALCEHLGPDSLYRVLLVLVRSLIFTTREDNTPQFQGYGPALADWSEGFKPSFGRFKPPKIRSYKGLNVQAALDHTLDFKKAPAEKIYLTLLGANAANMLSFDVSYQYHVDLGFADNIGWLDFTKTLAFGNAVRVLCERHPMNWPAGLLQMACSAGRHTGFLDKKIKLKDWLVDDPEAFFQQALDQVLDHGQPEYLVSVHLLKTLMAAREEVRWAMKNDGEETATYVAAAVNRFLNTPMKRKHTRRTAQQSLDFVNANG